MATPSAWDDAQDGYDYCKFSFIGGAYLDLLLLRSKPLYFGLRITQIFYQWLRLKPYLELLTHSTCVPASSYSLRLHAQIQNIGAKHFRSMFNICDGLCNNVIFSTSYCSNELDIEHLICQMYHDELRVQNTAYCI